MIVNVPGSNERMTQQGGWPSQTYYQFFSALAQKANYPAQGTTLNRPDTGVGIGFLYFDTDLVMPILVNSVSPVTWVDATGAPA